MTISYNWLKSLIKTDLDVHKIAEILTDIGLEVEKVHEQTSNPNFLNGIVVGRVEELKPHPNADKLQIAIVDIKEEENLQIVCGAPNISEGQKVAVAKIGAVLTAEGGKDFVIEKAKLRGVESFGMICSEKELKIGDDNSGIMILPPEHKLGEAIINYYPTESDYSMEIGLTPNRTDAMSHFGVARDLYAALKIRNLQAEMIELDIPEITDLVEAPVAEKSKKKTKKSDGENEESSGPKFQVEVLDSEKAPRYCGLYLENIQVKESPSWLKNRLKSIGLNPKNNVVDVTNYVLHHLGQPLHAFDADKLKGDKIVVKTFENPTDFTTLDEVERKIQPDDLMICDEQKGHCIAGVFGGLESGVTESTTRIFLESAYFEPVSVRKTSKGLGIATDSSFRFERGVDIELTVKALLFAAKLIKEIAGGKVYEPLFDIYPVEKASQEVTLRFHKLEKLTGERFHQAKVIEILELLDIEILNKLNSTLELKVPSYRADVTREVDIIEEILRIHGYNSIKIPEKLSFSATINQGKRKMKLENAIATALNQQGFSEAMNNSMLNPEALEWFSYKDSELVTMLNPLSEELKTMRPTLLPGLLDTINFNLNRGAESVELFEFGKQYFKKEKAYEENTILAIVKTGNEDNSNWLKAKKSPDFYAFKGLIIQTLKGFFNFNFDEKEVDNPQFQQTLTLDFKGVTIAQFGVVSSKLLKQFDIKQEVFGCEIFWDELLKISTRDDLVFVEPPKFPGSHRDLALLFDTKTKYQEIKNTIRDSQAKDLKNMDLFDVFESDKLPKGKKSYALRFFFQNQERTLTDTEVNQSIDEILKSLTENLNAELRD